MAFEKEAQTALGSILAFGEGMDDLIELRGSLDLEVDLIVLLVDNANLDLWSSLRVVVHGSSVR